MLEENPWEDESLRPEVWATQSQHIHGPKEEIKSSTVNHSPIDRKGEEEWGDFETFRRKEPQAIGPSALEDAGIWAGVEGFRLEQVSSQPQHSAGDDAWANAWTNKIEEPSMITAPIQEQIIEPDSAESSWMDNLVVQSSKSAHEIGSQPRQTDDATRTSPRPSRDQNVLFDADEDYHTDDDDDDFGEFEKPSAPTGPEPKKYQVNLLPIQSKSRPSTSQPPLLDLDLDADFQSWTSPINEPLTPSKPSDLMGDFDHEKSNGVSMEPILSPASPQPVVSKSLKPSTEVSSASTEDIWNIFEKRNAASSTAPSASTTSAAAATTTIVASTPLLPLPISLHPVLLFPPPQTTAPSPPPTNIPPPSLLLPLFNPHLTNSSTTLFTPLSALSPSQKQHPTALAALNAFLALAHTLAHILAGRKLRWKRDAHLRNATRIGPAASASASISSSSSSINSSGSSGSRGMKLASLDKAEAAREDREAAETLHLWRTHQVGPHLRAAARAAGLPASVMVPELAAAMPVRAGAGTGAGSSGTGVGGGSGGNGNSGGRGAGGAVKACALCGLRREERVAGVDGEEVLDGFGEWWVEFWGHAGCWGFWEVGKGELVGR